MDKPIPEAWMTPGGDVSRSFYWCLERCLPGQQPRPLYAAQQQGQAVADDMGEFASDTAALAFLRIIGNGNPNVERAVERLRQSLIAQPMQQGGGEGCQWAHEVVVRGQSAATSSGTGCAATGGRCVPGTTPDCPSAPPSAPVGVVEALSELVDLMQGVIDGEYKPDSFTLQPARAALAQQPSVAPVGVEGLPGLPCGVAVVTAKPGCGGTTAHVRIPQDAGTQLYSPQQVRDLMQQAAAIAQQPAAVDEARVVETIRKALHHSYGAGRTDYVNFTEALDFLATQHQEPTT